MHEDWKPIEEAPTNTGEWLLVFDEDAGVHQAFKNGATWFAIIGRGKLHPLPKASHWMKIPTRPSIGGTTKKSETRKFKIELTVKQIENLSDALSECQDEGPIGKGWASDSVLELREIVNAAMQRVANQR